MSQAVITDASMGDADAARRRLLAIRSMPVLAVTGEAADLAQHFLDVHAIPRRAAVDASTSPSRSCAGSTDRGLVMAKDPIVEEARSIREDLAKARDYDVHQIARALQREADDAEICVRVDCALADTFTYSERSRDGMFVEQVPASHIRTS